MTDPQQMFDCAEVLSRKGFVFTKFCTDIADEMWLIFFRFGVSCSDTCSVQVEYFSLQATKSSSHPFLCFKGTLILN